MSSKSRKQKQSTSAEVSLLPLKNCLVNLPASLVSVLVNANAPAQDVVVELEFRQNRPSSTDSNASKPTKSVYLGWTGMPSRPKPPAPLSSGSSRTERETASIEIDGTFARTIGLADSQKVDVVLHLSAPLAHTVNIEPLTPDDWEIIELHATFLELNLLSQIRALPNPSYSGHKPHPLTLHLSPTSTANITITSLIPAPPPSSPFARIASDAEVIVAPKARTSRSDGREARSVASTGRKSVGGKSAASTIRHKAYSGTHIPKGPLFFRGVDCGIGGDRFDEGELQNVGLKVWLDSDVLLSRQLLGATWVSVSVIKPTAMNLPADPQQRPSPSDDPMSTIEPATRVVARIACWDNARDSSHIALSSALCASLGWEGMTGGVVRIEAAPPPVPKGSVKSLRIFPFTNTKNQKKSGFRFGGQSTADRQQAARSIRAMYGKHGGEHNVLNGPLTHRMILGPSIQDKEDHWDGGLIGFDPAPSTVSPRAWFPDGDQDIIIEVQPEIARPANLSQSHIIGEPMPERSVQLVGLEALMKQLRTHLLYSSSVLLTGGLGSGKTSLAHLVGHQLRERHLFHCSYFPCRKFVTDETRASTIKDTLNRLFQIASWGALLNGRALVILDDLDRLCPIETELQVGGENGRSRQLTEILSSMVRRYCSPSTGVVLLGTAQGKETLNNIVVAGHMVREIVNLKAPNKEGRRRILEALSGAHDKEIVGLPNGTESPNGEAPSTQVATVSGTSPVPPGFDIDSQLDFLDIAGQTDGYMPADLHLLVSRARSEALIRDVQREATTKHRPPAPMVTLTKADFSAALQDFTPASLRNVSLQSSTTTFSSIGGLHDTRRILLETLQYPTTYAPIFAQCPLRLRSGLLLYGYPGCGKTLLASAVAGECGLNFISVKGPEILNKYIGASEKSVRDLFERAEAAKPCVLFFDEFDSIAPKRGHDSTGVTDRVVNQLLTQMDGAEGLSGVYVLAATSRPDLIDPALLRPGRLDKSLLCDLPGYADRLDILLALAKKLKMAPVVVEEGLPTVAERTEGYSGADLQALAYNAHLEAIHDVLDRDDSRGEKKIGTEKDKERAMGDIDTEDLLMFRFGEDADRSEREARERNPGTNNKWLAERAVLVEKMAQLKVSQQKRRGSRSTKILSNDININEEPPTDNEQPIIQMSHLLSSLSSTRSSISSDERRRLEAIYREFVVGRNGEMPSGEGGREVGGRSSLM
ncbi:MAG: Peroxisome biosynthesis protein pex1 [Caeruleum heppii]|nr:MAG: Peroxisome biosynthesis protein pex1 [Caeruleum heppii]